MLRTTLFGLLLVGSAAAAHACAGWQSTTIEQGFARASTIFVARIVPTEESQMTLDGEELIEGTFRVSEVFKGEPPQDPKVRSWVFQPTNCSIPLLAGWDYVFFLYPENDRNFVDATRGSFPLEGRGDRRLEELRKLSSDGKLVPNAYTRERRCR
jgi:hypothetical protein